MDWNIRLPNRLKAVDVVGLCPLVVVSVTLIEGFTIGMVAMSALVLTMITVSVLRHFTPFTIRLVILLLISTTVVTLIQLFVQTFFYELSLEFGIYLPLVAMNAMLLARLEEFALRQNVKTVLIDSFVTGLLIIFILSLLGTIRELLASGNIFSHAELLFGSSAQDMSLSLLSGNGGLNIIAMAPGAFIGLGLVIALKNWFDDQKASSEPVTADV